MSGVVRLVDEFAALSEADWHDAVRRARRSANGDVPDAVGLPLFAPCRNARPVLARAGGTPWRLVQRISGGSADAVAALLADDVDGGATGAEISFTSSLHPAGGKLPLSAVAGLAAMLASLPASFELRLDLNEALPADLLDVLSSGTASVVIARDPLAAFARGAAPPDAGAVRGQAAELERRRIAGAAAIADGRIWHAAGATDEQELAAVLATYVELLRLVDTTGRTGVALVADVDQFRTVAKFRAARLLIARVAELAMLDAERPSIHAETTWRAMTTLSAETNVVRGALAAFGAAVGGADSITVLPFDVATDEERTGARRLARNTQLVLAYEAGLARVADPGAGSGAIEAMTARLAESAWRRFQSIEKLGGMTAAISEGTLLRDVAAARLARAAGVGNGDARMIGVNVFREDGLNPVGHRHAPLDRGLQLVPLRLAAPLE